MSSQARGSPTAPSASSTRRGSFSCDVSRPGFPWPSLGAVCGLSASVPAATPARGVGETGFVLLCGQRKPQPGVLGGAVPPSPGGWEGAGRGGQRGANALPSSATATRARHPDRLRPPWIRSHARCRCRRSPAVDAGARCGLWEPRPVCSGPGHLPSPFGPICCCR